MKVPLKSRLLGLLLIQLLFHLLHYIWDSMSFSETEHGNLCDQLIGHLEVLTIELYPLSYHCLVLCVEVLLQLIGLSVILQTDWAFHILFLLFENACVVA